MTGKRRGYLEDGKRVAIYHARQSREIESNLSDERQILNDRINSSEELILKYGKDLPKAQPTGINKLTTHAIKANSWAEVIAEAEATVTGSLSFSEILSASEINQVIRKHGGIEKDFGWLRSLDRYDFALAVSAGILSGLIDIFLVRVPSHSGFLGSQGADGGWLSNKVNDSFGKILSPERIKSLEKLYNVSFDPASNAKLNINVEGLSPRTHRYQSLGHDPILGFIFGVKDILMGEFTTIDKFGNIIVQQTAIPLLEGEWFIARVLKALKRVAGHLLSDVATPAGLPAPLMPLLSFLQFGKIGDKNYSIAELSRMMYRSGYDFRHFIAASIPVAISELIIRAGYMIRKLRDGKSVKEAIPAASDPRLRRQLIIAHGTAGLINIGKIAVTKNPLGVSWPLVLIVLRYVAPETSYLLHGSEGERIKQVEAMIDRDYSRIHKQLNESLSDSPIIEI
ncbi:hypothetical protein [Salinicola sp. RZ23]|uniref:hypothetical protein n=1 Tax=Salinicola sp. RZ23 TaxID=1949087 RepID=UPI000DA184BF|nr:hypothetical protein [Salinicola sp. RZ23]